MEICIDCDGTGIAKSVGLGCTMPASECCGGCSFTHGECNTCNGTGEINNEKE